MFCIFHVLFHCLLESNKVHVLGSMQCNVFYTHYFILYFLWYVSAVIEPSSGKFKGLYVVYEYISVLDTATRVSFHVQYIVALDTDCPP